jgi:hypothetical protein
MVQENAPSAIVTGTPSQREYTSASVNAVKVAV